MRFTTRLPFPTRLKPSWCRIGLFSTVAGAAIAIPIVSADTENRKKPITELIRSYFVYSICSVPALVDAAPTTLSTLSSVPIVKQVTEVFVRATFFSQFVGADTALGALPLLRTLRASNKGALFAYSVEVDEEEARSMSSSKSHGPPPYKRIVNEMIHCIDVAADFENEMLGSDKSTGRKTWVAIKMTALLPDAQALINLSSHIVSTRSARVIPFPGCPRPSDLDVLYTSVPSSLSPPDKEALRELHADLIRICSRAQERGVKIIVDAEYSWYQPAIDALQLSLMKEFNKLSSKKQIQPLVYGTYQAYLRRTPAHLKQSLIDAKENGFALGVKLVRGAYHPHEMTGYEDHKAGRPSLAISPDPVPPVWTNKEDTDKHYNECAKVLIQAIRDDMPDSSSWGWLKGRKQQTIGVLFGTHNWQSCNLILNELAGQGLASVVDDGVFALSDEVTERLTMGQLFGMSDALTDHLVKRTRSNSPLVIKYVPYGALSEVMPYLSRRAIENKSILGNGAAAEERRHAGAEIRRRLFG